MLLLQAGALAAMKTESVSRNERHMKNIYHIAQCAMPGMFNVCSVNKRVGRQAGTTEYVLLLQKCRREEQEGRNCS